MKCIAFVITLLTLTCTLAQAQQAYFMFVWADNQQPFYVRLDEKTYSSSAIGHLVIPQLKDSTYSLLVGFPRKQFPEQLFLVSFNNKDLDYQLKHTPEDGWVLFNAQTSEAIKPKQDYIIKNPTTTLGERKTGAFATLLAGLVNDSSVMYKSLTKVDIPVKPAPLEAKNGPVVTSPSTVDSVQTEKLILTAANDSLKKDSLLIAMNPPIPTSVAKDSVQTPKAVDSLTLVQEPKTAAPLSTVIPVQEWWNDKGKGFIYYDSSSAGMDTISIMIDFDKNAGLGTPEEVIAVPARVDSVKRTVLTPDTALAQKPVQPDKDSTSTVAVKIIPDTLAPSTPATTQVKVTPDSAAKEEVKTTPANTVEATAGTGSVPATIPVKTDSVVVKNETAIAGEATIKSPFCS
ncbi:hypothetical protein [Paraflavitalea speifideaquila]|uniref:hypothetical protein n=1 Tax=Paraflavitalea speifideaquila TaxID=3076558 RepID=UPI0028EF55A1|nr:hypothetical protein [Paraflavitalea speifideiaquila]